MHISPLVLIWQILARLGYEHLKPRFNRLAQLCREFRGAKFHLVRVMETGRRFLANDFVGPVTQHSLRSRIERNDRPLGSGRDDRVARVVQDGLLQILRVAQRHLAGLEIQESVTAGRPDAANQRGVA